MPTLADIQQRVRRAVVHGNCDETGLLLVGGNSPGKRLAIHRRHYETSLVDALLGKFPGTAWLAGSELVADAARAFTGMNPPSAPCIAEYGADFPLFLASQPATEHILYLYAFAQLEWHLGHVAVAIDEPAATIDTLSRLNRSRLLDVKLAIQPGVRYLKASWPVDELMSLFLSDSAPQLYNFSPMEIWLEIRGVRGNFGMRRLSSAEFEFRRAIAGGQTVGSAAELALQYEPAFDLAGAFARIFSERLVTRASH